METLEVIKALTGVPLEIVLIFIIVVLQKQNTMLVEQICKIQASNAENLIKIILSGRVKTDKDDT